MTEVLLYHHVQGLTEGVRSFADELRQAGHTVHTPDLFDGDPRRDEISVLPTVLLRHAQPEQTELAHPPHDLQGEPFLPVVLLGNGGHDFLSELPHGLLEVPLLPGQVEVHEVTLRPVGAR